MELLISRSSKWITRISLAKKPPELPAIDPVESWSFPSKLRAVMLAQLLQPARQWLTTALARTLSFREALIVLLVLVVIGTIYCQIYCLLALQQMHGATMPVRASLGRASADVVPAFVAFEAGKRLVPLPRLSRWAPLVALFAAAIAAGV